jgi:hypothetical protein
LFVVEEGRNVFLTAYCPSAAAEKRKIAEVRRWNIWFDTKHNSCSAENTKGTDGNYLIFESNYSVWHFGIINNSWDLKKGENYPLTGYIDGISLGDINMWVFQKHFLVASYREMDRVGALSIALGNGQTLKLVDRSGKTFLFGLEGTRAALAKMEDCARGVRAQVEAAARPQAPEPPAPTDRRSAMEYVPREEALTYLTNMLSSAGVTGYQIKPKEQKPVIHPNEVIVEYRDGSHVVFAAMSGATPDADTYATRVAQRETRDCHEATKKTTPIPTTDGSVARRVVTWCANANGRFVTHTTIIRQSSGVLIEFTLLSSSEGDASPVPPKDHDSTVNSAPGIRM